MRPTILLLMFSMVCAAPAAAQRLDPGALVRVVRREPAGATVQGRLGALTSDSIVVLRHHRRDVRLPRSDVDTLYVGFQHSSDVNTIFGGAVGGLLGMLGGGVAGAMIATPGSGRRAIGALGGAGAGLVVGALIGGTIGNRNPTVSWTRVPDPFPTR